jgi:ATP/maltotriose-dependent transcriptional regulator MalT
MDVRARAVSGGGPLPVPGSKFGCPAVPARAVARPRLAEVLAQPDWRVALVTGGPATGKTVAVAQWFGTLDPIAREWVTLDAGDERPERFWLAFVLALHRAPKELSEFLLRTSVADVLDAELCNALSGRGDSGDVLRRMEADLQFVMATGPGRDTWRYHPLLAEMLRSELQTHRPLQAQGLNHLAAGILQARGDVVGAVRCLLAAGDTDRAFSIVSEAAYRRYDLGDGSLLPRGNRRAGPPARPALTGNAQPPPSPSASPGDGATGNPAGPGIRLPARAPIVTRHHRPALSNPPRS